jgi:hypothetical protein
MAHPDRPDTGQLPAPPAPLPPAPVRPALSGAWRVLLVPLLAGGLVALTLGAYANLHEPTGIAVSLAGFSGPLEAKVWLATGAAFFALLQLISALVMYGKVPGLAAPGWTGAVHRWSGRAAFLLSVPVAIHCLYAVGFATGDSRAMAHSVLGLLLYGAFVAKLLGLRKDGLPGWFLPVLGGTVFTALVGAWLTSAVWYFTTFGVRF